MNLNQIVADPPLTLPFLVLWDKACDEGYIRKFCAQPAQIADPANEWMTEFDTGNHHTCLNNVFENYDLFYCECDRCHQGGQLYGAWEEHHTGGYYCDDCRGHA